MRLLRILMLFTLACPILASARTVELSDEVMLDKIKGGWVGQVVGCAPAEEGHELLAVVQLSALQGALYVGDALLQPLPLPYAVPEAD